MSLADDFDKIGGPLQKPLRPKKQPAPPPRAAADATAVAPSPGPEPFGESGGAPTVPVVDEFERERARRASVQQGRLAAEQAARTGPAGQLDADLAQAAINLSKK
jgi:hypothetical protein